MSFSNYALKKKVSYNFKKYGKDVASIVRWNIYVDDMLKSFSSVEEAIRIIGKVKELCTEGAFNLMTFSSNSSDILKKVQDKDKKDGVKDKDGYCCLS